MSKIAMMSSLKCTNYCKIAFGHLWLSFNMINTVLICKIVANINMLVEQCAQMHIFFWKWRGCAHIGACALIRTNMFFVYHVCVISNSTYNM